MPTAAEAAGYSSLNPNLLCQYCKHGSVLEGPGGQTKIYCNAGAGRQQINMVVTKCSDHEKKDVDRLFDMNGIVELSIQERPHLPPRL